MSDTNVEDGTQYGFRQSVGDINIDIPFSEYGTPPQSGIASASVITPGTSNTKHRMGNAYFPKMSDRALTFFGSSVSSTDYPSVSGLFSSEVFTIQSNVTPNFLGLRVLKSFAKNISGTGTYQKNDTALPMLIPVILSSHMQSFSISLMLSDISNSADWSTLNIPAFGTNIEISTTYDITIKPKLWIYQDSSNWIAISNDLSLNTGKSSSVAQTFDVQGTNYTGSAPTLAQGQTKIFRKDCWIDNTDFGNISWDTNGNALGLLAFNITWGTETPTTDYTRVALIGLDAIAIYGNYQIIADPNAI